MAANFEIEEPAPWRTAARESPKIRRRVAPAWVAHLVKPVSLEAAPAGALTLTALAARSMRETPCRESDLRDVLLVSVIASRVLGTEMRRIYQYKLFIVEVEALPVTGQGHGSGYASPQGYVALVTVRREGDTGALFSPLRLGAASGHPFATEEDALATGFSAAQRVIDDTLSSD